MPPAPIHGPAPPSLSFIATLASLTVNRGAMRPVCRVAPLTEPGLAEPMDLSAPSSPSSPSEDLVFPFDGEGSQRTPLPYEQSAAAAFESIRQLEAILQPTSDAQMMVSCNSAADGAAAV